MNNLSFGPNEDITLADLTSNIFAFAIRYKILIFYSVSVSIIISFLLYLSFPKIYKSELVIQSDILRCDYMKDIIANLHTQIKEKGENLDQLAINLDMKKEEIIKIKGITSEILKFDISNVSFKVNTLKIKINSTDPNTSISFQDKLLMYLKSNKYAQISLEAERIENEKLIANINKEISRLDSTKNQLLQIINTRPNMIVLNLAEINTLYRESVEKKILLEKEYKLKKDFIVVQPLSRSQVVIEYSPLLFLFLGILGGIVFSVINILVRKSYLRAIEIEKNRIF